MKNKNTDKIKNKILGEKMKEKLLELINNSYSPYTKFPTAAIVVTKDGREFPGVNVEDASIRAGACAERTAIFNAVTAGCKRGDFKEINLMTRDTTIAKPCGTCRQMLYELFDKDSIIRCFSPDGNFIEYKLIDLCPDFFGPANLGE